MISSRPTLAIAATANWLHVQRSRVVAVVVITGLRATVHAAQRACLGKPPFLNGLRNQIARASGKTAVLDRMLTSARHAEPVSMAQPFSLCAAGFAVEGTHGVGPLSRK